MYVCEICGRDTPQKIIREIEGVKMLVCRNCSTMGKKSDPITEGYKQEYKQVPHYYLDAPTYPLQYDPKQKRRSSPSPPKIPKNLPIDRLELVEDYRDILKEVRKKHNLDQEEFANSVGITQTSYRHIEAGKLDLTIPEAKRIEKKYNVELTEFASALEEDEYEQYLHGKGSSSATLGDVYVKRKR